MKMDVDISTNDEKFITGLVEGFLTFIEAQIADAKTFAISRGEVFKLDLERFVADGKAYAEDLVKQVGDDQKTFAREAMRAGIAKDLSQTLIAIHCECDGHDPPEGTYADCHHDPEVCVRRAVELAKIIVPE